MDRVNKDIADKIINYLSDNNLMNDLNKASLREKILEYPVKKKGVIRFGSADRDIGDLSSALFIDYNSDGDLFFKTGNWREVDGDWASLPEILLKKSVDSKISFQDELNKLQVVDPVSWKEFADSKRLGDFIQYRDIKKDSNGNIVILYRDIKTNEVVHGACRSKCLVNDEIAYKNRSSIKGSKPTNSAYIFEGKVSNPLIVIIAEGFTTANTLYFCFRRQSHCSLSWYAIKYNE